MHGTTRNDFASRHHRRFRFRFQTFTSVRNRSIVIAHHDLHSPAILLRNRKLSSGMKTVSGPPAVTSYRSSCWLTSYIPTPS